MSRGEVLQHKNVRIVHIDLSKATLPLIEQAIAESAPYIQSQARNSVLCWVNTEGTTMTKEISDALKMFTLKNKPYIKMTAITGLAGVQKVVLSAIIMFTKRDNLVVKKDREEALDFLVSIASSDAGISLSGESLVKPGIFLKDKDKDRSDQDRKIG
jgi:hypothetical protein